MVVYEFCAENTALVEQALQAGAKRIELCDHLEVGGTTPSLTVLEEVLALSEPYGASVCLMIRPRGGDFIYNKEEVKEMCDTISRAKRLGCQSFVFGALTSENQLDHQVMKRLTEVCGEAEKVCHMAFDEIPWEDQRETLEWLIEHGVDRVLSRGNQLGDELSSRLKQYQDLIQLAAGRIQILPGGGITLANRQSFLDELGVNQLHGTRIVF